MKIKNVLLKVLGLVLFIFILSKIDLRSFFNLIKNINLFYFILAALMAIPILVIKSYRWNYLKRSQGIKYKIKESILMYGSGIYFGVLTPGRIGDFIKVLYLRNDGNSVGKSFVSVFIDRIFDLFFLAAFGYFGMFFFAQYLKKQIDFLSFLFIAVIVLLIILFSNKRLIKRIARKAFNFFIPKKHKEKIRFNFNDFYHDLKIMKIKTIIFAFLLTSLAWLVYFIQMFFLAKSLNLDISFFAMALFSCIAGLITLIPVSISGIGTRDLTIIFLFSLIGINKEYGVAVSMLILSMTIVMAIIGLSCWFRKPINIKNEA